MVVKNSKKKIKTLKIKKNKTKTKLYLLKGGGMNTPPPIMKEHLAENNLRRLLNISDNKYKKVSPVTITSLKGSKPLPPTPTGPKLVTGENGRITFQSLQSMRNMSQTQPALPPSRELKRLRQIGLTPLAAPPKPQLPPLKQPLDPIYQHLTFSKRTTPSTEHRSSLKKQRSFKAKRHP